MPIHNSKIAIRIAIILVLSMIGSLALFGSRYSAASIATQPARPARALKAAAEGADYVAIGSVFPSSTKPGAVRARLSLLAEARAVSGLPVVAIGGITARNAGEAIAAGADMVALISALFDAPDIRAAAREIARLFNESPRGAHDVRAQPRAV